MSFTLYPGYPIMICSEVYRTSRFGGRHPLSIERITPVMDLCMALGWLDSKNFMESPIATPSMLTRFHDLNYVKAVIRAEQGGFLSEEEKVQYNLGRSGNPIFPEMFRRPATTAGASIVAGKILSEVDNGIVYSPAGGNHHGRSNMAYGFCFFNDPVLGIFAMLDGGLQRILYVDLDAHHGDGVQDAFDGDNRVLTISIHEEHRWPGTGLMNDRAGGMARNLPVPEGFNDSELDAVIRKAIIPLSDEFYPDAIVIQSGCDGLADDPQSKLSLSNVGLKDAVILLSKLAPRVLVIGGGGYNPWATARAWTLVWGSLNDFEPPQTLSNACQEVLRSLEWRHSKGRNPPDHWYSKLEDRPNFGPIRKEIETIIAEVIAL